MRRYGRSDLRIGPVVFSLSLASVQERVAAGVAQYAHGDGLGSVRLVTDSAGGTAGAASYEPWGAPKAGAATLGGFGYTGEQADGETGLAYLRARSYDPATGRFLQQDPAGL